MTWAGWALEAGHSEVDPLEAPSARLAERAPQPAPNAVSLCPPPELLGAEHAAAEVVAGPEERGYRPVEAHAAGRGRRMRALGGRRRPRSKGRRSLRSRWLCRGRYECIQLCSKVCRFACRVSECIQLRNKVRRFARRASVAPPPPGAGSPQSPRDVPGASPNAGEDHGPHCQLHGHRYRRSQPARAGFLCRTLACEPHAGPHGPGHRTPQGVQCSRGCFRPAGPHAGLHVE
mmetsp:Transcript_250/g.730  ORF Transcript_250/g.730 Transcript_250/m.730 type:complete len:232 (+) Transcript_250:55-750(+)